jgi:N-acetylglucosamine-6-phosphate deacetylase
MKIRGINVFDDRAVEVEIEEGEIRRIIGVEDERQNLPYLCPGFFDVQVNGYKGSDYSLDDLSCEHVQRIIASLALSGTTQHVPTIISSPKRRILRNLETIAMARKESRQTRDAIPGVHIEGPFLSPEEGPRGAHDSRYIREPDFKEFEEWQSAAEGRILYVTVAPERKGAIEFIERVVETSVVVSLGHHGATAEDIRRAIEAGARMSTHLGN